MAKTRQPEGIAALMMEAHERWKQGRLPDPSKQPDPGDRPTAKERAAARKRRNLARSRRAAQKIREGLAELEELDPKEFWRQLWLLLPNNQPGRWQPTSEESLRIKQRRLNAEEAVLEDESRRMAKARGNRNPGKPDDEQIRKALVDVTRHADKVHLLAERFGYSPDGARDAVDRIEGRSRRKTRKRRIRKRDL